MQNLHMWKGESDMKERKRDNKFEEEEEEEEE